MFEKNYNLTKKACYTAYFTMSSIFSLPPLLFVTFREKYGISYTLLGTLVLVNFFTQLAVDLLFTFFPKYFNVNKLVKTMPLMTCAGLLVYAIFPTVFPQFAYIGLLAGTVIFAFSAGLSEVLLSPIIAAIPSDNPQRDMSTLHSLYAFGVFTVVVISTVFLKIFSTDNWVYITVFWAVVPISAAVLFMLSPIPEMNVSEKSVNVLGAKKRTLGMVLCVACIFFGSCAENTMSNWISGYMENALHIDKAVGDILGMALFAVLLGAARIGYAKFGKNIFKTLLIGMIGASVCYIVLGVSSNYVVSFAACILTGLFTAMLWPGTLILMEENIPCVGVAAYALMAAGGDTGASIAPQLMGIVVDSVSASSFAAELAAKFGLTVEQVGMRTGMLISSIFPIIGTIVILIIIRYFRKKKKS